MTTNFLPAGILNEQLEELAELAAILATCDSTGGEINNISARIYEIASGLLSFINGFSCQPLIFTGIGSTEEIIARLEWLITFNDEQDTAAMKHAAKKAVKG